MDERETLIPLTQLQPPIMPRPDIAGLGIKHRRIPILSIGRDVYLDTRLIIQKLENVHPEKPKLGASDAEGRAFERLLESHAIDAGVFSRATQLIPTDLPLLQKPEYYKDRADYAGAKLSKETMDRNRPEAENEIGRAMDLLETTLLADGRDWILKTNRPGLADIEAVWPLHWVTGMPGALPADKFSPETYPKVYAWIARFQKAVSAAKGASDKPQTVTGEAAMESILHQPFHEEEGMVDKTDGIARAAGLNKGDVVVVWPTDSGSSHRDVGRLVSLDRNEIVMEAVGDEGMVRVHAPRHGFRLKKHDLEEAPPKL
jgi:glutathione S-transferase